MIGAGAIGLMRMMTRAICTTSGDIKHCDYNGIDHIQSIPSFAIVVHAIDRGDTKLFAETLGEDHSNVTIYHR